MADIGISDRVRTFVVDQIDSVMQLEILLLLHGGAARDFTAANVARELRIDPAWAEPQLAELCARGLLTCTPPAHAAAVYRYAPKSPELHETIAQLAQAYSTHRVTLTALIFSKPPSPLRSFTDAFRLRKDPRDG